MIKIFSSWIPSTLYAMVIAVITLWPFNFDFDRYKNYVQWDKDGNGLKFRKQGQVVSKIPPIDFFEKLTTGSGLTVEVWIRSYHSFQEGPARIVSYSLDTLHRNFSLAQSGGNLIMRLRTTATDLNGMDLHLEAPDVFHDAALQDRNQHIVYTYNCIEACVYVNGKPYQCERTLTGDFLNWDSDHLLVIGNEVTGDRPWLGEIDYAAIYNRALVTEEIADAFKRRRLSRSSLAGGLKRPDRLVFYTFDEKEGTTIADKANDARPINLYIPSTLPHSPFDLSGRTVWREFLPSNFIPNVFGFLPLGFLLFGYAKKYSLSGKRVILATFLLGFFIAFGIEYLQHYLPAKHSSAPEFLLKLAGFALGMMLRRSASTACNHFFR